MRMRRQFQPAVDRLPYRIAPSSLVASPALTLLMSHATLASQTVASSQVVASSYSVTSSQVLSISHPAAAASGGLTMSANDTDMPEDGTSGPILAGPPPSSGGGTVVC